jgi:hypothetical protein
MRGQSAAPAGRRKSLPKSRSMMILSVFVS